VLSFATVAPEVHLPLNGFLALGQIVVSVGLMAAILLQARGAGLSSAFGGDSAVYRSRRGIEKRLFQFTILLGVLFVVFSLITFRIVG
jgi:preprotein translocase subunit SecG